MKIDDRVKVARREGKLAVLCTLGEIQEFEKETGLDLSRRMLGGVKLIVEGE